MMSIARAQRLVLGRDGTTLYHPKEAHMPYLVTYHSQKGDQPERYERIRAAAKNLAQVITECTPAGADQSAAIRKVREACFTANAAIACGEAQK